VGFGSEGSIYSIYNVAAARALQCVANKRNSGLESAVQASAREVSSVSATELIRRVYVNFIVGLKPKSHALCVL